MSTETTILYNELDAIVEATLFNAKTCAKRNGTDEIKVLTAVIYRLKKERETLAEKAILEQGPGIYIKDINVEETFYDCWRDEEYYW